MKKAIALVLSLMLAFALCACGGSSSSTTESSKADSITVESKADSSAAQTTAEVTEAFIQESAPTVPAESTHPFDAAAIEKAAAEALSRPLGSEEPKGADEDDEDDDDDAPGSRHIILKIIAIVLIVCALFEGAVLGLKKFAPEAPVTQSAVQIEEAIGEAVMSFFDTVSEGISRIFNRGGN